MSSHIFSFDILCLLCLLFLSFCLLEENKRPQYIPNLCLICTCRRAGPNPLVDLPRHGSFLVQIFTSFGVQVLCSDFAAVLDTLVLTPASYKKLKFSLYALPSNMAAPALHLADNRFPTNSLPPRSLHSDLSDVQ